MRQKIKKMVEDEMTVTTCDKCGKEIGNNRRGDFDGYGCSLCDREYCYDCFNKMVTAYDDLCLHVCDICQKVENGDVEVMVELMKEEDEIRRQRFDIQHRWKERSKRC